MTAPTERDTGPARPKRRSGGAGTWLLIGAMLLCPLSKIVTLAAVGGIFGGLLDMPWLLIIIGVAIAGSGGVLVRMLRGRGTRCQSPASPPGPGQPYDK